MLIIYVFKILQCEILVYQFSQFVLYRLCPIAYQHDKLVYIPCHMPTGYLRIIAFELGGFMLCHRAKILLLPYLAVQFGIVDKR